MIVRAEVQYDSTKGIVHSDIDSDPMTAEGRAFLRANFEEWLRSSGGTGYFYIGDIEEV